MNDSNSPDSGKVSDNVDNDYALLKELEAALHDADKKGPKIQQQPVDIALKCWYKKLSAEKF